MVFESFDEASLQRFNIVCDSYKTLTYQYVYIRIYKGMTHRFSCQYNFFNNIFANIK